MPVRPVSAYPTIRLNTDLRELLFAEAKKRLHTPEEEEAEKKAHERCLEAVYAVINTKATAEEMVVLKKFGCAAPIVGIRLAHTADGSQLDFCFCLRDVRKQALRHRGGCTEEADSEAVKACALPVPGLKDSRGWRIESRYEGLSQKDQEVLRPFVTDYCRAADATNNARGEALRSVQALLKQTRTLQDLVPVMPWAAECVDLCAQKVAVAPFCTEEDVAAVRAAFAHTDG